MLSCKEVSYIVSESLDGQLPWHDRIKVRIHLFMCEACQRMARQMELLRTAARHYRETEEGQLTHDQESLSEEACSLILKRLHETASYSPDNV